MAKTLLRGDMPLTSFDPKYHEIIMRGTKETVEIPQSSKRDAKRLKHLLTMYRVRYRDHWKAKGSDRWEALYSAIITVTPDGMSTLIKPRTEEAAHLLRGLELSTNPSDESLPVDPLAEFGDE